MNVDRARTTVQPTLERGPQSHPQDNISPMYALGLDTTAATLRLGLSNFSDVERWQAWELGRQLSVRLHANLAKFIAPQTWTDLAWIAVACGPGSFTGTRIGIVTATTLAQQLQLPLFSVSTLAIYACAQYARLPGPPPAVTMAVAMPGQKGRVHGGIYQFSARGGQALIGDRQWLLADWEQQCQQHPLEHQFNTQVDPLDSTALSQALLTLAHLQWHQGLRPPWQQTQPYYSSSFQLGNGG